MKIDKETGLKPCPFCGSEAEIYRDEAYKLRSTETKTKEMWFAMCINCPALTSGQTKARAIERWNRRYNPDEDDGR